MKKNRYALITGATSGIGYELAKLFAADGWNLIAVARSSKDLLRVQDELRKAHNTEVITFSKDLFVSDNANALYQEIKEKGIEVEILVNDAGQGVYGEFVETEL